ncbi:MAG: extracellular solute-binding protein [Dehalococcoidia bacterium]|nr:extracellular solute-binding protein [Dehalococcoidia bacterium]
MQEKPDRTINRREFMRLAGIAGIGLAGMACAPAALAPTIIAAPTKAPAADAAKPTAAAAPTAPPAALKPEQVRAQLYEAAKKEGQVVVYATGTSADMEFYRKGFSQAYPGIEIKEWMGTNEQILEKMTTEFKAGKVNADQVMLPLDSWLIVKQTGIGENWKAPESVNFPAGGVDPDGLYVLENAAVHVISYNTQSVPAAEAPKSYDDLLKPYFKGKLGLEQAAVSWFTQRIAIWGKDKTVDYCKKLAAQNLKYISGHTTLADAVVSGEIQVAVNVYQHRVEQQKAKGAPVKWAVDEPAGLEPNCLGLAKNSPHPNAGKLFLDWRLSEQGALITYRDLQRYPTRNGAALPPEMKVKLQFPTMQTSEQTAGNTALFKQIFGLI